ncbi:hypothetical protein L195_g054770 [Trifolium pratense]|uniref:Uncharacterized protein n=1 Tax=Trifolium pratense TaxID=57577 RepID=A0A2K3KHW8_TRIPR|nr:hypothetical protein L195_g054770 [Trifolium pratense]
MSSLIQHVAENNVQYGPPHSQDRQLASVTKDENPSHEPYVPTDLPTVAPVPPGAPMETIMATLVNTINRQGEFIHKHN